MVTLNSLNTPLTSEEAEVKRRNSLFPNFGYLYPEGIKAIRDHTEALGVQTALEHYPRYLKLFEQVKSFYDKEQERQGAGSIRYQSIEDLVYAENVFLYEMAFEQQYHFGVFYAWVKLREQEIRNIRWAGDMIILNKKDEIDRSVIKIFQPRN